MSGFSLHRSALRLAAKAACAASLEAAYEAATDIVALETRVMRAGIEIARLPQGLDGSRPAWKVQGHYLGRTHRVQVAVLDRRDWESLTLFGRGARFSFQLRMIFLARGPDACELRWDLTLAPQSITGRLMLPAMKLARRRLERRMTGGLQAFAQMIEAGYEPVAFRKGAAG